MVNKSLYESVWVCLSKDHINPNDCDGVQIIITCYLYPGLYNISELSIECVLLLRTIMRLYVKASWKLLFILSQTTVPVEIHTVIELNTCLIIGVSKGA